MVEGDDQVELARRERADPARGRTGHGDRPDGAAGPQRGVTRG